MSVFANPSALPVRAALARVAGFLAFWVILIGFGPVDLVVGLITAAAATWTSLRLLPPQPGRVRLTALLSLIPHFLWKLPVRRRRRRTPRARSPPAAAAGICVLSDRPLTRDATERVHDTHQPFAWHCANRGGGPGSSSITVSTSSNRSLPNLPRRKRRWFGPPQ